MTADLYTRPDLYTHTEQDAAWAARHDAWPDDRPRHEEWCDGCRECRGW